MDDSSYQLLCTEFYDLSKPEAGPKEIACYEKLLRKEKGPLLEAMCGSGRLLIPLLKKGMKIDGIDSSPAMLDSCKKRCEAQNLPVRLFQQSLTELSLPEKYGLIFIAVGSFQLFKDRSEALRVLQNLHEDLLPGGVLILDVYVPWDTLKNCIDGADLLETSKPMVSTRKVASPDGFEIKNTSTTTAYPKEQFEISEILYEKLVNERVIATEKQSLAVRWYYRYELELLLEKCGFVVDKIWEESFEHTSQAILYRAVKR